MNLKDVIRNVSDFPIDGIQFKDIESLTENPELFHEVIEQFAKGIEDMKINKIVALDARGFLVGAALSYRNALPLVMVRKAGKLPGETVSVDYSLEYNDASVVELQKSAINVGDNVLVIDDLLATGGTAQAAGQLVNMLGGNVVQYAFVIELDALNGRAKLEGAPINALVHYGQDE